MSRASAGRARARSDAWERRRRRRPQRIELRRQSEDGVDDGGVRVRQASAEVRQNCGRASGARGETRRLCAGEIEAVSGRNRSHSLERRLVERRQSLPVRGRAAVEQATPMARADDRRRQARFSPEIRLLAFDQTLRTELQPGGLPPPAPARRKIGAQRRRKRARRGPGERYAADGPGSKARAADEPIPHLAGSARSSRLDLRAGTQIERQSERPGRQTVAEGQPMQPARKQFVGLMDPRRPANGPIGGRGSRGWTSLR